MYQSKYLLTIGTLEERGMLKWCAAPDEDDPTLSTIKSYDLPFCMEYIKESRLWKYLPFSPTFQGFPWEKQSGIRPRGIQLLLINKLLYL